MHFSPTTCAHTHTHAGCIANLWLPPLIHPPSTHSQSKKDVFSLLSFHVYISNTPWYSKLVKNRNPWPCRTCRGKHDGSGSAGTNIPGVPSISHSVYISFFFFFSFFLPGRVAVIFAERTESSLALGCPCCPMLLCCALRLISPLQVWGASDTLSPQQLAWM